MKKNTEVRYTSAVRTLLSALSARQVSSTDLLSSSLSETKGLLNRCVRQDQWDWSTVHARFNYAPPEQLRGCAQAVADWRIALKSGTPEGAVSAITRLERLGAESLFRTFLIGQQSHSPASSDVGWLYVLSTRDQRDVLKIGMTTREVTLRAKEINSATGVLVPLGVRAVFRVTNARLAEKSVFHRLNEYRLRPDREFFRLDFHEAVSEIRIVLSEQNLVELQKGTFVWKSSNGSYGVIERADGARVFVHEATVGQAWLRELVPGDAVAFAEQVQRGKLSVSHLQRISG